MNKEELKKLAATLNGIADGRAWEVKHAGGYWSSPGIKDDCNPMIFFTSGYKIRLKPEQRKVPLGPSDVPPGTVLRGAGEASNPEHQGWCMITSCSLTGIRIWRHDESNQKEIKWETLMDASSEIWRPTDTFWEPCYKLIDTP